jgi:hypothetical protein
MVQDTLSERQRAIADRARAEGQVQVDDLADVST